MGRKVRSKEETIEELKEFSEEPGKSPSKRDVKEDGPNGLIYDAKKHFGSWNEAKESAGLETYQCPDKEKWSKKKVVQELKSLANKLGRSPSVGDNRVLAQAAVRYFGSWNEAKESAGLETYDFNRLTKEKVLLELRESAWQNFKVPLFWRRWIFQKRAEHFFGSYWNAIIEADAFYPLVRALPVSVPDPEAFFRRVGEIFSAGFCNGVSIESNLATSVYLTCREKHLPVSRSEVKNVVERRVFVPCRHDSEVQCTISLIEDRVKESVDFSAPLFTVSEFVERFSSELGLRNDARRKAKELSHRLEREVNTTGKSKRHLSTGIIYISGILVGPRLTQENLSEVCGVSDSTVSTSYRWIAKVLDLEVEI